MKKKAIVYSPYLLNQEELKAIIKKFSFLNDFVLENIVDKSLLVGIKIVLPNKIIEVSLKKILESLKNQLYELN